MQEKRNMRLLISLSVLSVITVASYFFISQPDTEVVDKTLFRVDKLDAIDRVELNSSATGKIELKLHGTRWRVNDQPADPSMVDVLFATLQQAEPKRPVASSMADSVNQFLEKQGVSVKLFEGETLQKEFIAGGNASKTQAWFKNGEESYVVVIPGYRVYAAGIFELEENGWRDKYVFNFNWRNFKYLKATFPASPQQDFEVQMGREYFEIKGLAAVDTTKLNNYLDAISLTTVDQFVKNDLVQNLDSLLKTRPQMEIQVSEISGKEYKLSLYPITRPDVVLGMVNGNQASYISKQKVKNLFREKTWFAKK